MFFVIVFVFKFMLRKVFKDNSFYLRIIIYWVFKLLGGLQRFIINNKVVSLRFVYFFGINFMIRLFLLICYLGCFVKGSEGFGVIGRMLDYAFNFWEFKYIYMLIFDKVVQEGKCFILKEEVF